MIRDILLEENEDGLYDISFEDGDLKNTDGLDSNIVISLFVDKRASDSEVFEPELRRGWIGNEQNEDPDYDIGSKLWLIYQARSTPDTLNLAIDHTRGCFAWMLNDTLVKDIQVTGERINANISVNVNFIRFDNSILNQQFLLWENTNLV